MNLLDAWFKMDVGEGAFYAVFGLVFVIFGIVLLVLLFSGLGLLMRKITERREKREEGKAPVPQRQAVPEEEEIPPEVVAAITAALAVYMEGEKQKCDFVVRRIRKISFENKE